MVTKYTSISEVWRDTAEAFVETVVLPDMKRQFIDFTPPHIKIASNDVKWLIDSRVKSVRYVERIVKWAGRQR